MEKHLWVVLGRIKIPGRKPKPLTTWFPVQFQAELRQWSKELSAELGYEVGLNSLIYSLCIEASERLRTKAHEPLIAEYQDVLLKRRKLPGSTSGTTPTA